MSGVSANTFEFYHHNVLPDLQARASRRSHLASGTEHKVKYAAKHAFFYLGNNWGFVSRGIAFARLCLKTTESKMPNFKTPFRVPISSLTFSLGFYVLLYPSTMKWQNNELKEGARVQDAEGVALAKVGMIGLTGDLFDAVLSMVRSAYELTEASALKDFISLSIPLAYVLTVIGMGVRGFDAHITNQLYSRIESSQKKEVNADNLCKSLLGISKKEREKINSQAAKKKDKGTNTAAILLREKLITKKERQFQRRTSAKAMQCVRRVIDTGNQEEINQKLKDVKTLAKRKVRADYFSITTGVVFMIGLTLLILPDLFPPFIPFFVLAITAAARLGLYLYERDHLEDGLFLER